MSSNPQVIGHVGATPIVVDAGGDLRGTPETRVAVTLMAPFQYDPPPGWPAWGEPGSGAPSHPGTITEGTTVRLLRAEAAALVAAGAAVLP